MIVTGQDGAIKLAIEEVLTESKHRLFTWHIMQKILAKICKEIYDQTDFKERLNKIVWNMFMEPIEFEENWSKLIEDFGLQNYKWMTKMFKLREIWLPAYFIDSRLFGLMRTTSRSESENVFFKSFTNHGSTEKTNKHAKTTCPLNPKYVAKLARIAAAEQGAITAADTEQATRTATAIEQETNVS
ncbi:FAR1-related sequence 5-like protein [Tanacetum coccineum]